MQTIRIDVSSYDSARALELHSRHMASVRVQFRWCNEILVVTPQGWLHRQNGTSGQLVDLGALCREIMGENNG
jgi:hypothetical protein